MAIAIDVIRNDYIGRPAAASEVIVAHADIIRLHESICPTHIAGIRIMAGIDGVLRCGRAFGDILNGRVGTEADGDVKFRRIGKRDVLDQFAVATCQRNHNRPDRIVGVRPRPPRSPLPVNYAEATDFNICEIVALNEIARHHKINVCPTISIPCLLYTSDAADE